MPRLRLIHWKEEASAPRAEALRQLGYDVDATPFDLSSLKELRRNPPAAVIIDLSRRPSHGRGIGVLLRGGKATRLTPLIYVEGAPEKVDLIKALLPDARYTAYAKIVPVLEDALANPPREAVVPKPLSTSNTPTPLAQKLGVKEGQLVGLVNAPTGFETQIPNAETKRNPKGKVPLTLWFVKTRNELEAALPQMRQRAEDGGIWIVWPKQTKTAKPDINGNLIRKYALAHGLVDFKICAVDYTWSAMRFAIKRP